MVPRYRHQIGLREGPRIGSGTEEDGLGAKVLARVSRLFCALHGHDSLLQFERDRMFLRCVSCGYESPGWAVAETPPTVKIRGDARRHALVRSQLVSARRIA